MASLTKEVCPRNSLRVLPDFRPCILTYKLYRKKREVRGREGGREGRKEGRKEGGKERRKEGRKEGN